MISLWLAAALLASQLAQPLDPGEIKDAITAIGDVHGDIETFRSLLRRAGLIDVKDRWSGEKRRLILTGDILDRGAGSRQVMELLMRLEVEAKDDGGRVTLILGNHELMNISGDLVSTTLEEMGSYAADELPADRERHKERILKLVKNGSPLLRSGYMREYSLVLNETTFDRFFPRGFFAHRAALSPEGRYGKWLLTHDIIHREDGVLFLHGGLSPTFGRVPIAELNRSVKAALKKHLEAVARLESLGAFDAALGFRELRWLMNEERRARGGPHPDLVKIFAEVDEAWNSALFREDGPLWYRGLAEGDERLLARDVDGILRAQEARAIVIGHTQPKSLRIETRFQGKVVLIDTGMNQAVYRGRPSALLVFPTGEMKVLEN